MPLTGALVSSSGTARSTFSDSAGRFSFDSVRAGQYTFVMLHEVLDSAGLSGISGMVRIADERHSVRLAIPSLASLQRAACGPAAFGEDRGILFGTVRNGVDSRGAAGVPVTVAWTSLLVDSAGQLQRKGWSNEVITDGSGDYALCGVPPDAELRLRAGEDPVRTPLLTLPAWSLAIQRRDLVLSSPPDQPTFGTISLAVADASGKVLPGARVLLDGIPRAAPSSAVIPRVRTGTHQLHISAIGYTPRSEIFDVRAGDTTVVSAIMERVVTLAAMGVSAKRSARQRTFDEIDRRRQRGLGAFIDSTAPTKFRNIRDALQMSVKTASICQLFVDGISYPTSELFLRHSADIATIEVQPAMGVPVHYRGKCEGFRRKIVLVWTKSAMP